jgi:hypothetical protein
MDNIELQIKKLRGHWTSQQFTVSSKADVDNIRSRFDKCDKKSKVSTFAFHVLVVYIIQSYKYKFTIQAISTCPVHRT